MRWTGRESMGKTGERRTQSAHKHMFGSIEELKVFSISQRLKNLCLDLVM